MREKEFLPLLSERLGIEELNPMQVKMMGTASENRDIILLAPTGSGKTLGFVLPVMKILRPSTGRVQVVVIAPSRELVIQIAGVMKEVARGFKVVTLYGGHNVEDEVNSLSVSPDIIIATPGRLLDHINRRNVDVLPTRVVVLDEFDKSLELGFADDMKKILGRLKNVSRTILTSATDIPVLPEFVSLNNPEKVSYIEESSTTNERMRVHKVATDEKDKLKGLKALLSSLSKGASPERSIIFVNHRESAERVAQYLEKEGFDSVLYHGALQQIDREKNLAMFNNGSRPILVATDLAARGLDIEGVKNIVHYHQALTPEAYTHRNGRTARQTSEGDIYVLVGPEEDVKDYIDFDDEYYSDGETDIQGSALVTLYFFAGKKEKLSRGDILGFLAKDCGLSADQIGRINVFDHYSLAAVPKEAAAKILGNRTIKGKKRRITLG